MARQSRFIIRRITSCTGGALHKSAFSDETAPFHSAMKHFRFRSNMKHSAYAPYDLSSIALRATDDEKMKNESCVCKYSLPMLLMAAVPLHTPSGVLHKNAFSDEAASFHFTMKHCSVTLHNMKHSAYAPYDEKMKNESCVCKHSLPMLHYSVERKNLLII